MDFSLLSKPVQKSVWKMGWKEFTDVQEAAIQRIITTDHNYILASATASGKTEAVFLPILSLLSPFSLEKDGVLVLYISPLRALINDQFIRIEELCRYIKMPVMRWHSDVPQYQKEKFKKRPRGILQITPESLEALFIHHPEFTETFFPSLSFIIIDELHSFLGESRGVHLKSILERLRQQSRSSPRIMGLSATINDFTTAKFFMGQERKTFIIKVPDKRPLKYHIMHFESDRVLVPQLVKDIYLLTQRYRSLIFTNSRSRAEELAVKLKRMAKHRKGHSSYFSHHSSISKEEREHIEKILREKETPLGVCCTSTLELGIDIGSMDLIIQVDASFSVSSLIQRLGRSGRKEGTSRMLQIYTTDPFSLLQSLACMELYREGFIDATRESLYPIDVLFQQILSILVERRGLKKRDLLESIKKNMAFQMIEEEDMELLISFMIEKEFIQDIKLELILGAEGEVLLNNMRIYATFDSSTAIRIFQGRERLGTLPFSPLLKEGENILLGARMWEIQHMDLTKKRIHVIPATTGKPPLFLGHPSFIHSSIREKMLAILYSKKTFPYLHRIGDKALKNLQERFAEIPLNPKRERPYFKKWGTYLLYTFTSSHINHTLLASLMTLTDKANYQHMESSLSFTWEGSLPHLIEKILDSLERPKDLVQPSHLTPFYLSFWATYLPRTLQIKWLLYHHFDLPGTREYLETISFKGTFGEGPKEEERIQRG